jgi:hypothetical protein
LHCPHGSVAALRRSPVCISAKNAKRTTPFGPVRSLMSMWSERFAALCRSQSCASTITMSFSV